MTANRTVIVHEDKEALIAGVAERFLSVMSEILEGRAEAHVVLTGGSVGVGILSAIADSPDCGALGWDRLHLWWGDERWLSAGDAERNDAQADEALLSRIAIDPSRVHRFPSSDAGLDLDDAARAYRGELAAHAEPGAELPRFDLVFLGVGGDAHIASLFPESEAIRVSEAGVVAVRSSPKPPPERLSLTLPAINSAERIWLCLAGSDKASALGLALAGANAIEVPVSGVEGRERTVFFVDRAAAADLSPELVQGDGGS